MKTGVPSGVEDVEAAASATPGCEHSTSSSSAGATWNPLYLISSLILSLRKETATQRRATRKEKKTAVCEKKMHNLIDRETIDWTPAQTDSCTSRR